MRRRHGNRAREVPVELLAVRHFELAGEHEGLRARFSRRSPGEDLAGDVAEAGGVELVDLAVCIPARVGGSPPTLDAATSAELVAALPRARQRGAQTRWLGRHLPPEQHEQARAAMLLEELCHHYG